MAQAVSIDERLLAAKSGKEVKRFLSDGADVSAILPNGDSPLHVYVRDPNKYDCLLALLFYCDPSCLDMNYPAESLNTPLHVAAQVGNVAAANALISFGADLDSLNIFDETPVDLAIANRREEMHDLLRSIDGQTGAYVRERVNKFLVLPKAPTSVFASLPVISEDQDETHSLRQRAYSSISQRHGSMERAAETFEEWIKWKRRYHGKSQLKYSGNCTPPVFHMKDGHRVLCLDGGGIRGLIQVEVLQHLEEATGRRIPELFDWIVGTSTGGIVALAIVYKNKTLASIRKLYFELKEQVFATARLGYGCDTNALEKLLKREFGVDDEMVHLPNGPKVLITSVDKSTDQLKLCWFNNCFRDARYYGEKLWKVARYTSAAPCYFSSKDNFVDGGILANNPSMCGITRIQDYFRDTQVPDKISVVVSIGCGLMDPVPLGETDIQDYLFFWRKSHNPIKIVREAKNLVTMLSEAITNVELEASNARGSCQAQGILYYRFNPRLHACIPLSETDNRKLCRMIVETKMNLSSNETQMDDLIVSFCYKNRFDANGPIFQ